MNRKGQSTMEFAILIAIVVGALLVMQIYLKRGIQGKLRSSADNIGEQYSAGCTTSKYTTTQIGCMSTRETFGVVADGTGYQKGVSYYKVTKAAQIVRNATGTDEENVTKKLKDETIYGTN